MDETGQLHAPAALSQGKSLRDPLDGGGWVGARAGLDAIAKKNISAPAGNRTPVIQPV
jgi:hypothetical protein